MCIKEDLIDLLILTDNQFKERFSFLKKKHDFEVYISDYFVNKDLFTKLEEKKEVGVFYFGHLISHYGRTNEYNLPFS